MTVKMKKWIIPVSALLCILLAVYLSVVRFSAVNIDNLSNNREEKHISVSQMVLEGWDAAEFGYLATDDDSTVKIMCDTPIYVNNLLLVGEIDRDLSLVSIRYRTAGSASTVESKEIPVEVKNDDLYLSIGATITELELTLSSAVGSELELEEIVFNPRNLNVHYQNLLLDFAVPFVLIVFLVELFTEKEGILKMLSALKNYRCLLSDLVSRDIKTKYRRSVLGILWSVLNPLLMMLVLTAVFANIFRYDITDFPVYYLTGYILFNFVSESTTFSMASIIGASGLIKKVYIPKIIFPLEKCLFSLVNLLFSLIAAVIVFLIAGVTPSWTMLLFFVPILLLFVFNFGLSLILATMNTFFRDVGYLYGVFITLWVYLTPIIYPINILPGWMQSIVRINPLTHYVEYFRALTLYGTVPSLNETMICVAYSVIFLLLGIVVFQKKQNKFIFYI